MLVAAAVFAVVRFAAAPLAAVPPAAVFAVVRFAAAPLAEEPPAPFFAVVRFAAAPPAAAFAVVVFAAAPLPAAVFAVVRFAAAPLAAAPPGAAFAVVVFAAAPRAAGRVAAVPFAAVPLAAPVAADPRFVAARPRGFCAPVDRLGAVDGAGPADVLGWGITSPVPRAGLLRLLRSREASADRRRRRESTDEPRSAVPGAPDERPHACT